MMFAMATELTFDPDALREKYREERDKRLRADGNEQYREVTGSVRRATSTTLRYPRRHANRCTDDVQVVIVGGGFSGLLAGARLRDVGVESICIVEAGADVGGTWYWNKYPGVQCDIESYIYLPLLEELGYMPKEKYAYGPEIWAHTQAIARHYRLYDDACFQHRGRRALTWDGTDRWIVETDRDDRITARFVITAIGPLSRPKLPGIPGVETFGGHSFHTSRWDYAYTGGDTDGGLTGLADKRVGIIGTGATAVQCVPHLGEWAQQLYVFQRTPSSIDVRGNRPTDPEWVASLSRAGNSTGSTTSASSSPAASRKRTSSATAGPTSSATSAAARPAIANTSPEDIALHMELVDFEKMEQIRARVDEVIGDQATAEALKPYYRQFCKRPCFHDDYLDTFNRPNVTLVDTSGEGRRADHRARRRRRRGRVRARLPHLRDRLRGRHRLHAARRVRRRRSRRADAQREVGRPRRDVPRHPRVATSRTASSWAASSPA